MCQKMNKRIKETASTVFVAWVLYGTGTGAMYDLGGFLGDYLLPKPTKQNEISLYDQTVFGGTGTKVGAGVGAGIGALTSIICYALRKKKKRK